MIRAALAGLLLAVLPSSASAQPAWLVDLARDAGGYVSAGVWAPGDPDVASVATWGVGVGLVPHRGWGVTAGLGWFSVDLLGAENGFRVGEMHVKPLLGGVAYTWERNRLSATASALAGVSFNSARLDPDIAELVGLPAEALQLEIRDAFTFKPTFKVEYFLAHKVSVRGQAAYVFTTPDVRIVTPDEVLSDRWDARSANLSFAVAYYPFRRP